jgi:hypothetical protein
MPAGFSEAFTFVQTAFLYSNPLTKTHVLDISSTLYRILGSKKPDIAIDGHHARISIIQGKLEIAKHKPPRP